jgi:acetoin utilization protein AcuB
MAKRNSKLEEWMTRSPHSIGAEQTLARAGSIMKDHAIRHLPVLHGGRLVGMVTDRDVHFVETMRDVAPNLVTVADAMTSSVYAVSPETPLGDVAREMATHKYGSAVAMNGSKVVGIFTTVDACNALAALLREGQAEGGATAAR